MKKTLLLVFFSALSISFGYSQTEKAWKPFNGKDVKVAKSAERASFPTAFKLMQLNLTSLKNALVSAPDRFGSEVSNVIISIPNVDGKLERFQMYEASNFEADLQAMYPEIRSYVGIGLDDKYAQLRLSIDPRGIQTMTFRADKSNEFIEAYSEDNTVYAVYASKSARKGKLPFTCATEDTELVNSIETNTAITARSSSASYKTFRLALSCTAEYSNYFGAASAANSALVMAAFNATMARVNGIYERDLAIHMNIVAQSTNVIYYNPATDPYSDAATGANGAWNAELQNTLSSSLTGSATSLAANNAAYDIGHLFGASGGGGNAGCIGCVCDPDTASTTDTLKGSGYTSPGDDVPEGDTFDVDYVAHEMGHQFGANHTHTHSTENNAVNYEPGSGSTIMAYAGITAYDVQSNSDDYFHAGSIQQIQVNVDAKACPVSTAIMHSAPVVNAGADYTIPTSTPFMLTGSATDAGGAGAMTYCWEQYNDATALSQLCNGTFAVPVGDNDCVPAAAKTTGPAFRSYDPTSSPIRHFPRIESTLAGSTSTQGDEIPVEFLCSTTRSYIFRLTARDNAANGGQTNFDNATVTVANKTPLTVTMAANTVYPIGSSQTVIWTGATGASGHSTIAGGANVDILFSADNGVTWTTLLANTTNDNSQAVTLPPGVSGAYCRFMVKANANIFYNISAAFAVGNYTYQNVNVCSDYVFNINDDNITETSDSNYPGINLPIADDFVITDVNFHADITHPNIGQFNLLIIPPWTPGVLNTALWYNQVACTGANMDKWFDTAGVAATCTTVGAPAFRPYSNGNVSAYAGNNSAGNWAFYYKDAVVDGNATNASLNSITIQLCRDEIQPVLATESFGINDLVLYPNPNNGNFNVQFTSNTGNEIKINVHDLRGRNIFNKSYTNNGLFNESLKLNSVQAGIYMVTIQDGARTEVKKIVIE